MILTTGTALQWYMIAGTTSKPHLRSRPHLSYTCTHYNKAGHEFLTSSPNSAPLEIKTQWKGITCMNITSRKVPPSKTMHDQLRPTPLPRSFPCAIIYAFSSKLAPMTVTWADSVCLHRSLDDERSRESRETKVDKAIDILKVKVGKCPHNRHSGKLTGKSINYRKRGRSRKGRSWSCTVLEEGTFVV